MNNEKKYSIEDNKLIFTLGVDSTYEKPRVFEEKRVPLP